MNGSFAAALVIMLVPGCARELQPGRLALSRHQLDAGEVFLGTPWSGHVGWTVEGETPVEILDVGASCGCSRPRATLNGKDIASGRVPPRTRGILSVELKSQGNAGRKTDTVWIVWRSADSIEAERAMLAVTRHHVLAFEARPTAIAVHDASRSEPTSFAVEWEARVPASGSVTGLADLPAPVSLRQVRASTDSVGHLVVRVEGTVSAPRDVQTNELRFLLEPLGTNPPVPPVAACVSYVPLVTVTPMGLVQIVEQDPPTGRGVGTARVAFAQEATAIRLVGQRVMPQAIQPRTETSVRQVTPGVYEVLMDLALGADRLLRGSVVLETDDPDCGPIEIPWVFVRHSPGARDRGERAFTGSRFSSPR